MPKIKNKDIVKSLKEKISKAKSITITDYLGLSSDSINQLRQKVKEADGEIVVAKNTLLKVALKEEKVDITDLEKDLEGPTAIVFSYKDPIASVKALFETIKEFQLPKIKSAIFDGKYTNAETIAEIKDIPSKEVLISRLLGSLNSPIRGFVLTLTGVQKKLVYALNAIKEKGGDK